MNPLEAIVRRIVGEARRAVDDTRRQAPGARMIGEFTVRQLAREARRRLGLAGRGASSPDPARTHEPDSRDGGAAG